MLIARYEAAENAMTETAGSFHVRGVEVGGMTQFESQSRGGFDTHGEAQEYASYLNSRLVVLA